MRKTNSRELWVRLDNIESYNTQKPYLVDMINRRPGDDCLVVYINEGRKARRFDKEGGISADGRTIEELKMRFGNENIAVKGGK